MPPPSISLPPSLATRLSQVRARVGASQVQLAEAADVAQGTVSNLLQGNASRSIGADYARAVIIAIQTAVESHIATTGLAAAQADELLRPVAEALAFVEGRTEEKPRLALPGGAIHPEAGNRVVRKEFEGRLVQGLQRHPAMMRIDGGPQSGKSTLLRFAEHEATILGRVVTYFDSASLDAKQKRTDFFPRLVRELAVSWGDETPSNVVDANDLKDFVRARRQSHRGPAIVIVDVPADLSDVDQEGLVETCRLLRNSATDLNLSWLLALQPPYANYEWFLRSEGYFYPDVMKLKAFSESEVLELLQKYPKAAEDVDLNRLMQLFGGQPFLTHVAIEHVDRGEAWQSVERLALAQMDSFGIHLRRMLEAMGPDLALRLRQPQDDDMTKEKDRQYLSHMNVVTIQGETGETQRHWSSSLYENSFGPGKVQA